jgi:TPR repeat protein
MRISSFPAFALGAFLVGAAAAALALDVPVRPQGRVPASRYASANEAVRSAVRDYNAGDKEGAVQALEFAAKQGHALARWKLGHMYANGDGVPHDDLKAFEHFSKIVDDNAQDAPDSPNARAVANAYVALGTYFLDGIKGTYVKPDVSRAHDMFHHAASYFGDANAQFNLARLYLDGTGVGSNPRQAARWFNLAAEKGHHQSQALLGHILVHGQTGVPRQPPVGLMWLSLAREAADPVKDRWISELYDKAFQVTSQADRQRAALLVEQYAKRKR